MSFFRSLYNQLMPLVTLILGALEIDLKVSRLVMMCMNAMEIGIVRFIFLYILQFLHIILMQCYVVTFSHRNYSLSSKIFGNI